MKTKTKCSFILTHRFTPPYLPDSQTAVLCQQLITCWGVASPLINKPAIALQSEPSVL